MAETANGTLIPCLDCCRALSAVKEGHLPEKHPRHNVSNKDVLLVLVFDRYLAVTLGQDIHMRALLSLLDDKLLWQELLRLDAVYKELIQLRYSFKDRDLVNCA